MKKRYWLCRRSGVYYLIDARTKKRQSLRTSNRDEAERLLHAKLESARQPQLNLALARAYLAAQDPRLLERTWASVMEEFIARGRKESTKRRRERAMRSKPFGLIRGRKIIETTGDDLRAVIKQGGVFTSECLKCLHNLAMGLGWLPWPILPSKLWPHLKTRHKRAITWTEHQRIITTEKNPERRLYYELLWEIGAAQTDAASLTAENIDWAQRVLAFQRRKTGEWCHLEIGSRLEALLRRLPSHGSLFPKLANSLDTWRAAEFYRRCKLLGIQGISLHSYRYAWAERAKSLGVPERYAQQALGHSSKAVHRAYARDGVVVCPSLEDYEKKIVPLPSVQVAS